MDTRRGMQTRGRGALSGPLPALPRPVDALSERWAALPPRARAVTVVVLALALVTTAEARVQIATQRWGGEPTTVLVAERDHAPGELPVVRTERRPRALVPPGAASADTAASELALALPTGAVLTDSHLDPAGPGATLPAGLRAVPIPVEDRWGVTAGGWVDVWDIGGRAGTGHLVAGQRAVLELDEGDERAPPVAIVALATDEVPAVTAALASGGVLLAHAPAPPGAASSSSARTADEERAP